MSELPLSIGTLHFTGIGGIGMSGIAEILFEMGYRVQGSDMSDNANVKRLRARGISVMCGQNADNLGMLQLSSPLPQSGLIIPKLWQHASAFCPLFIGQKCLAN